MLLHHPNDPPPLHAPPAQCLRLRAASTHSSALRLPGGPAFQLHAMVANVIRRGQFENCHRPELIVTGASTFLTREARNGAHDADGASYTVVTQALIHRQELNGAVR